METPIHQPALASLSCCRHTGNFCWCEILSWPSSRLHKCAKPVAHPKYWRVKGHKHQGQDPWLRRLRREQYPARQRAQEAQDLHPSSTPSSPVLWSSSQGHLPKSGKVPEVGKTRGLAVTPLPRLVFCHRSESSLGGTVSEHQTATLPLLFSCLHWLILHFLPSKSHIHRLRVQTLSLPS